MSTPNGSPTTTQPSSILFFIAIAIGILIAIVFIFFSLRYYVRTKLGIYATARLTTSGPGGTNIILLNSDFPIQQLNLYNHDLQSHIRAQRRRRRYLKKRRLTEEEVDHLFPSRTYQNWMDGGAERDIENRAILAELKQEDDQVIHEQLQEEAAAEAAEAAQAQERSDTRASSDVQPSAETTTEATTKATTEPITKSPDSTTDPSEIPTQPEVDLGNPYAHEIHYDSGTCAICIDTFEPDDIVRGLICGHVFHQDCLDPWLTKRKACCPMCKRDYYMKNPTGDAANTEDGDITAADDQNDAESIAGWPELQYTTLEDRVTEILQRHPELEDVAREKVKSYMSFKWRVFWMVMGISNADLINCTVASEDQRRQESGFYASQNNEENQPESTDSNNDTTGESSDEALPQNADSTSVRPSLETRRETVERLA